MEQFQMPTVYKYHLMIFGPESARRLHRAPFVYSARPYSNGELGQVLHAVQVAINDSADHSMGNIDDLVEFPVTQPMINEQKLIVRYLDKKTHQIDLLINNIKEGSSVNTEIIANNIAIPVNTPK